MVHHTILETLWLLLPAGVANMMPVVAARYRWLPSLNRPLDGSLSLGGKRLLGANKTWRGLLLGLLFGSVMGYIQYFLSTTRPRESPFFTPYFSPVTAIMLGGTIGLAALVGDAVKSFLKRRLGRAPGKPWVPFDQIDFVVGAVVVGAWYFPLTPLHIMFAFLIGGVGSYLTSFIGAKLKIKQSL
jgi:CDP-2,3-bis-(O-geranylgeranyl)-sn-glycerol synthase